MAAATTSVNKGIIDSLHGLWKVTEIRFDESYMFSSDSSKTKHSIDRETDYTQNVEWTIQFGQDGKVAWTFPSSLVSSEVLNFFNDLISFELDLQYDECIAEATKKFEMIFRSNSGLNVPAILVSKGSKSNIVPIQIKFQFAELKIAKINSVVGLYLDNSFSLFSLISESFDTDMIVCDNQGGQHKCHSSLINILISSKAATWLQGKSPKMIEHVIYYLYSGQVSPQLSLDDGLEIQKKLKSENKLPKFKIALSTYLSSISTYRRITDALSFVKVALNACISHLTDSSLYTNPHNIPQVLHSCIQHIFVSLTNCALAVSLFEDMSSKDRKSVFTFIVEQDYLELLLEIVHAAYNLANSIPQAYQVEFCQTCSTRLAVFGKLVSLSLDSVPTIVNKFAPQFVKDLTFKGVKKPLSKRGLSLFKDFQALKDLDMESKRLNEKRERFRSWITETEQSPDKYRELFQSFLKQLRDFDENLQRTHNNFSAQFKAHKKKSKVNKFEKEFKKYVRRANIPITFLKTISGEAKAVQFWESFTALLQNEEVTKLLVEIGFTKPGPSLSEGVKTAGEDRAQSTSVLLEDNSVKTLCTQLWSQLNGGEECLMKPDLKITVSGGREFRVHSLVVAARCPWIRRALLSGMTEALEKHLRLPQDSYDAVFHFLSFIYTGKLSLEDISTVILVELIQLSDQYELEALTWICAEALILQIDDQSAVSLHELGVQTNQTILSTAAFEFMKRNYKNIPAEELGLLSTQLQESLRLEESSAPHDLISDSDSDSPNPRTAVSYPFEIGDLLEKFRNVVGVDPSDEILTDILIQADGDLNRAVNFYLS